MTELLAVLTAIFVVYALYEVFATVSQSGDGLVKTAPTNRAEPSPPKAATAQVSAEPVKPPVPTAQAAPPPPKPMAAEKHITLRNPKTGETSPVPGNYRFAKKWIKEALVSEGLLPKVYKNSELTETLNAEAKTAIETFKHLSQYHA